MNGVPENTHEALGRLWEQNKTIFKSLDKLVGKIDAMSLSLKCGVHEQIVRDHRIAINGLEKKVGKVTEFQSNLRGKIATWSLVLVATVSVISSVVVVLLNHLLK